MHEVNHTLRNTVDIVLCILMMQVELLNKQVAQMITNIMNKPVIRILI